MLTRKLKYSCYLSYVLVTEYVTGVAVGARITYYCLPLRTTATRMLF